MVIVIIILLIIGFTGGFDSDSLGPIDEIDTGNELLISETEEEVPENVVLIESETESDSEYEPP